MGNMRASMIMDMNDRVSGKTRTITQSFTRMSKHGQRAMYGLARASNAAYNGLDRMGNRMTGFIAGAGGAMAVRSVAQLETRLVRLGIQSNRSSQEIDKLNKHIVDVSRAPDIRIDPSQILDAMDKIIEKTGDFDLARDNVRNIGLVIQATGAAGADAGAMIADMAEKFDIDKPQALFETLDLLTNQGKQGAFTLQNFATQGERVSAAYAVTGRVGKEATREMGAMLQMIRKGVGAPEQAATAFEALMRTLNDGKKRKLLTSAGIQISDPEDPKRMRSVVNIVKDLVKVTGGDAVKLSGVFDSEAMKALNLVAAEYSKTGGFDSLDSFMGANSNGDTILKDAQTAANRAEAKASVVWSTVKDRIFNMLKAPLNMVTDIAANISPNALNTGMDLGIGGMFGLGALALGVKGHKMFTGARGGAAGRALSSGAALGVQKVMVTNWPLSLGRASGQMTDSFGRSARSGGAAALGRKAKGLSRFARLGKGLGRAVPYLGAGLVALDVGSAALSGDKTARGEALGSGGGAIAGAAAGAAIGSVVPVIGTAIGAALGGVLGSLGGGELGKYLASPKDKELAGEITIKVDSEGRPSVKADMGQSVHTTIDQGVLMEGAL